MDETEKRIGTGGGAGRQSEGLSRAEEDAGRLATVDEVEGRREELNQLARNALGIGGDGRETLPLREGVRRSGVGWYPLIALAILLIVNDFQTYGFYVLGPEIRRSLGVGKSVLALLVVVKLLAVSLATLPMAAYVQRVPRRALVSVVTAFMWSLTSLFTGFVANAWGLFAIFLIHGSASGSIRAVQPPLLIDLYPSNVRVRAFSFYQGGDALGNIIAPLTVGFLIFLGLTWRGVFFVGGCICILAVFAALRLRDPGFGVWDVDRVRQAVRQTTARPAQLAHDDASLGFFEIFHRLMLIPTVRRLLTTWAVWGMFSVPLQTYLFFYLDERWNMGVGPRSLFYAGMSAFGIFALFRFGRRGEEIFQKNPVKLVQLTVVLYFVHVFGVAIAVAMPVFPAMIAVFAIVYGAAAVTQTSISVLLLSVVAPRMRTHAAALAGIAYAFVGGIGGILLLGGIDRRFGIGVAIAFLAVPGTISSLVLLTARRSINEDFDRMLGEIVEDEEIRSIESRGGHLPMLACRHVDFSYGHLQVLFDVNFAVDDGEIVALLGTNGAGKSTLLRVISGVGLPTGGTVRYRGADVTYIEAERRLRMGITQVPGGRAVFGPLSVVENLRIYGYSHGRSQQAIERGIEATFDAFPVLAARRNQLAVTLSGGEQQMLGLGRAFILKPTLLLIDELSLGLAPRIVSELLEMVRRINQAGTAVVLVEQSVTVALSLVEHAYFMEKGEIRFDGGARDLLGRRDLLRSVFLEGAAKNLR